MKILIIKIKRKYAYYVTQYMKRWRELDDLLMKLRGEQP